MAYDFVINPPKDSMMSKVTTSSKSSEFNIFHQAPVLINGLLVSQRLPTIDMKNPVDSLTKVELWTKPVFSNIYMLTCSISYDMNANPQIANKAIKLFTTWKLDLTPHVKEIRETLTKIYEKQVKQIFVTVKN